MTPLAFAVLPLSIALIGLYRHLAWRWRWLDAPTERSSHTQVIPRGAGIVFAVLITLAAIRDNAIPPVVANAFLVTLMVALVGWWDDLRGVAIRYRLALYWAISATLVWLSNPFPNFSPWLLWLAVASASIAIAWLINLYNFMDGINGIAAFEGIFVLGAALWLGADSAFNAHFGAMAWVAIYAMAGFLLWNFPAARVFMGDAGSAYSGALLGLFILLALRYDGPPLASWLILLGIFIVDTAYTLAVRALTGQRWYMAHRLHAYQRLSLKMGSHAWAVLIITGINLMWLLPWAWWARAGGPQSAYAVAIAYAPLIVGCYWLKAGIPPASKV